jgi:hypothetical protein
MHVWFGWKNRHNWLPIGQCCPSWRQQSRGVDCGSLAPPTNSVATGGDAALLILGPLPRLTRLPKVNQHLGHRTEQTLVHNLAAALPLQGTAEGHGGGRVCMGGQEGQEGKRQSHPAAENMNSSFDMCRPRFWLSSTQGGQKGAVCFSGRGEKDA